MSAVFSRGLSFFRTALSLYMTRRDTNPLNHTFLSFCAFFFFFFLFLGGGVRWGLGDRARNFFGFFFGPEEGRIQRQLRRVRVRRHSLGVPSLHDGGDHAHGG